MRAYVSIYATQVRTYVHYLHTHTRMQHVHTHARTNACMHGFIRTYIVCMHGFIHTYIVRVYVLHACVRVCVCVMHVCTYLRCVYTNICTHACMYLRASAGRDFFFLMTLRVPPIHYVDISRRHSHKCVCTIMVINVQNQQFSASPNSSNVTNLAKRSEFC